MKVRIECGRCGTRATVKVVDSVPYCPKCGKPIYPSEIKPKDGKAVDRA